MYASREGSVEGAGLSEPWLHDNAISKENSCAGISYVWLWALLSVKAVKLALFSVSVSYVIIFVCLFGLKFYVPCSQQLRSCSLS